MSTAAVVPETWELSGDDATRTLRHTGRRRLLADAFQRMRVADGFSHARSLAFLLVLVVVQGLIALVGLASALGGSAVADVIVQSVKGSAPGPAGQVLTAAVEQAQGAAATQRYLALVIGLVGALVSATTAVGQLERGLNRLYGVEQDRPALQKYTQAFGLALSAGALATLSFVALAYGREVGDSLRNRWVSDAWALARWPLAVLLIAAAVTMLFRWCPRRRQPDPSWLAFGSIVSVLGWLVATLGLALFFDYSTSFGDTYGPLAGVVALLLWALLSSIAVLFGASTAAQLEAVRAQRRGPQDQGKVAESEPDAARGQLQPVGR